MWKKSFGWNVTFYWFCAALCFWFFVSVFLITTDSNIPKPWALYTRQPLFQADLNVRSWVFITILMVSPGTLQNWGLNGEKPQAKGGLMCGWQSLEHAEWYLAMWPIRYLYRIADSRDTFVPINNLWPYLHVVCELGAPKILWNFDILCLLRAVFLEMKLELTHPIWRCGKTRWGLSGSTFSRLILLNSTTRWHLEGK